MYMIIIYVKNNIYIYIHYICYDINEYINYYSNDYSILNEYKLYFI